MEKLDRNFADFLRLLNSHGIVTFDEAYPKRREETIDGVRIPFIDLGSLLKNKEAAGRMKGLADIEGLTKSSGKKTRNENRPQGLENADAGTG